MKKKTINMKYTVILKQDGEGCDYTIGCGMTKTTIEANSLDEAKEKLNKLIIETYPRTRMERGLAWAELYEEKIYSAPVEDLYAEKQQKEDKEDQEIREKKDREEFERLKEKFAK